MRDLQTKEQALARVSQDGNLSQVALYENAVLMGIIESALAHPVGVERWFRYELLKLEASKIVGWDATLNVLRTTSHYEAMIDFIDRLLPQSTEEDRIDEQGRERFYEMRMDESRPASIMEWIEDLEEKSHPDKEAS